MIDYAALEERLTQTLTLTRRPVAIAFRDQAPASVTKFAGTQPSGCSFWKLAADGRVFYTVPSDHYNCPIGSYTHNIPLPPEREHELRQTLSLMGELGYVSMDEVPRIPRLKTPPTVIVYAALGQTPVDPDAVIVTGMPGGLMLLHEAAARSNVTVNPMLGRPTCMAIPAAMGQALTSSYGCIGNRVYTDLPASELYSVISGADVANITNELETIVRANAALRDYHTGKIASLRVVGQ
jgi:uncharacterized protein (DUF169 family)